MPSSPEPRRLSLLSCPEPAESTKSPALVRGRRLEELRPDAAPMAELDAPRARVERLRIVHVPAARSFVPPNDPPELVRRLEALAASPDIEMRELGRVGGWPLYALRLRARGTSRPLRVILTAGVHGVEPAGPAAVVAVVEQMIAQPELHMDLDLTTVPLVNPLGYQARVRGNGQRVDLNRAFTDALDAPPEVVLVRQVLRAAPYDVGIDLHSSRSAGQRGYFALHRDALDLLGPAFSRFGVRYPILSESTERYTVEGPGILRSSNCHTLKDYLSDRGVRWAVTIEAPAAIAYESQVYGSTEIVHLLVEVARELTAAAQVGSRSA